MRWTGSVVDPAGTPDAGDELVDVVDDEGRVTGTVTRRRLRSARAAHRATFVVHLLTAASDPAVTDPAPADPALPHPAGADPAADWGRAPDREAVQARFDAVTWAEEIEFFGSVALGVDADTPITVHRRAEWKDVNPGFWDIAFGGVVGAGESWLDSARRELSEEAGLNDVPILAVGAGRFDDPTGSVFGGIFIAPTPTVPKANDGEVVEIDQISVGELARWCRSRPVCADSKALILPVLNRLVGGVLPNGDDRD